MSTYQIVIPVKHINMKKTMRSPPHSVSNPEVGIQSSSEVNNVSHRKRTTPQEDPSSQFTQKLDTIQKMFLDIKKDIKTLHSETASLSSSVGEMKNRHEEVLREVSEMKTSLQFVMNEQSDSKKQISELSIEVQHNTQHLESNASELNVLRSTLHQVQMEHNKQQQFARLLNLEIIGLNESNNENLTDVLVTIARYAGVTLTRNDVEYASRVQPMNPVPGRPRCVIVKLRSRAHKDGIIAGLKKKRGITTKDIQLQGPASKIFVNDHLTQYNRQLLKSCKILAQEKGYSYTWLKNCRIFMRKADGAPLIKIESEKDLQKII